MKSVMLAAAAALFLAGCGGKVKLPHRSLSYAQACPGFQEVRCQPDADPSGLIFNLSPPPVAIVNGQPAYDQLIGRAFRQPYTQGAIGRYCNAGPANPFAGMTLDTGSADGTFVYRYRLRSNLKAGAELDIVQAATAAGLPPTATENVRAAASAAFNKARNREVSTTGIMRVIRLPDQAISEIRFGTDPALAPCRQFLAANPDHAIIKAATIFHIQRSNSDTQITSDIAAEIKAAVAGVDGANLANINSAIDRSVQTNIQTALADRYIVWAATWLRPGQD